MQFPEGLEDSLFKSKVPKYQWNYRPHATVVSKFGETPNIYANSDFKRFSLSDYQVK